MIFSPYNTFGKPTRLALLVAAVMVARLAGASSASFLVSVATSTSPPASEWLLVTNDPFGYTVLSATNGPSAAALEFSPDGKLFAVNGNVLSVVDPSNAASSNHLTLLNTKSGATVNGATLAFVNESSLFVGDGYNLYSANSTNGACALINTFHTNGVTTKPTTPIFGLATAPNGTLFGAALNLYTIDPATASASAIGLICDYPLFVQARDMAFGADGNLYMIGQDPLGNSGLYSVNTNNAQPALIGELPGTASGIVNSINPAAPAITSQPASLAVLPGQTARFSVSATGVPALSPEWYFDGSPYPQATNFTLTITNASSSNAGSYFVVLTNVTGAITSDVVTLTVTNLIVTTNFTFLASSSSTGVHANSILSLSTNPVSESVLQSFNTTLNLLGFDTNNDLYGVDDSVLYKIDTNSWETIPVGPVEAAGSGTTLTLSGMAFSPSGVLFGVSKNVLYSIIVTNDQALATRVGAFPEVTHISAIAFGPTGILYGGLFDLYTINPNNAAITSEIGPIAGSPGQIPADMKFGPDGSIYFTGGPNLNLYRLNPLTAQPTAVATFDSFLSGLAFYPSPINGAPPAITSPQTNAVAALGGTVTFYASVTSAGPSTFQWRNAAGIVQNGSRFAGATTRSLTISNLMPADAGLYSLAVTNVFGGASNIIATLTVGEGPVITIQPAPATRIVEGRSLILNVTAKGGSVAAPLQYQWMAGDSVIPGATNKTLTITANPINGVTNLFYMVFIDNDFGATLSAPAQVSILPYTAKPSVAITFPVANARTGSNTISGTASADATQVLYWTTNINNGVTTSSAPVAATPAHGSWSATAALLPGTNVLTVQSSNPYGNVSAEVTRSFFYEVKAPLTVVDEGGSGTFTGKAAFNGDTAPANGAMLNIGEGYSITAKPAADSLFVNWTGTGKVAATPTIQFIMASNLSLTADFTTNEFFGLAGIYEGLFPNYGAIAEESSGIISGLAVSSTGTYSGSLVLEGTKYRLSGSFNANCQSSNYIPRSAGALGVSMTLLTNNYPNQIVGEVSTANWQSDIHLVAQDTGPLPSAAYTMALPPDENFSGGYGYAVITNHAGSITFAGKLADGAIFQPTVAISQDRTIPLYASLYGNTGMLTGWLDFDAGEFGSNVPQGQLTWIRKAGPPGTLYARGFTNTLTVMGSTWVAPPAGSPALPALGLGYGLEFSGGNLASSIPFVIAPGSNNTVTKSFSTPTNSLTGSINPKTGLLTFTFGNGNGKSTTTSTGVLLQDTNNGYGAFLGATNSGTMTLTP